MLVVDKETKTWKGVSQDTRRSQNRDRNREWVRTLAVLLFRWKAQSRSRGYDACNIGQLPLHFMGGSWCISISLLDSIDAHDSFPLHLQLHVCPSDLLLHLGVRISLNMSSYRDHLQRRVSTPSAREVDHVTNDAIIRKGIPLDPPPYSLT